MHFERSSFIATSLSTSLDCMSIDSTAAALKTIPNGLMSQINTLLWVVLPHKNNHFTAKLSHLLTSLRTTTFKLQQQQFHKRRFYFSTIIGKIFQQSPVFSYFLHPKTEESKAWNPNLRSKAAIRTTNTPYYTDPSIGTAALGSGLLT